jgi:hypothetical protein
VFGFLLLRGFECIGIGRFVLKVDGFLGAGLGERVVRFWCSVAFWGPSLAGVRGGFDEWDAGAGDSCVEFGLE